MCKGPEAGKFHELKKVKMMVLKGARGQGELGHPGHMSVLA